LVRPVAESGVLLGETFDRLRPSSSALGPSPSRPGQAVSAAKDGCA
jgi:hypothetical protein